jgi:hypothetical protein
MCEDIFVVLNNLTSMLKFAWILFDISNSSQLSYRDYMVAVMDQDRALFKKGTQVSILMFGLEGFRIGSR